MRIRVLIFILSIPLISLAQSGSITTRLVQLVPNSTELAQARTAKFIQKIRSEKPSSDYQLLKKVFHGIQRDFLKEYVPYSQMGETFGSGKYDCLTATSLFSLVLQELDFKYRIIETNYHIFLLVQTSRGDVLLETTDRFNGLIVKKSVIKDRIGTYRDAAGSTDSDASPYQYHFNLCQEISLGQLPGLLYYNQAVKAYNAGRLEQCAEALATAQSIYDTPRIKEFGSIFLQTVKSSSLDETSKQRIINKLMIRKGSVLAAR